MGQSRRNADRKIELDVWRCRTAFVVKAVGILILFMGLETMPKATGSAYWGLSLWHYVQVRGIFIPVGGWLIALGVALLVVGRSISREWLF